MPDMAPDVAIRAVVLDIGSVLEVIDDAVFPGPFEARHGLAPGSVLGVGEWPGDAGLGEMTEAEVRAHWQRHLGLDDEQADELMGDYWTWYRGTLDRDLFDWFAGLRGRVRTGILSNSGPGAREAERCWGFEQVSDDIVYSHEVGLRKPDPAIYALAAGRLGVEPHEAVLLDDVQANVDGAVAAGWHAVRHVTTSTSIREVEALLAGEGRATGRPTGRT
jgi:HAD superfamily hydrolase (TIGR01549 family)